MGAVAAVGTAIAGIVDAIGSAVAVGAAGIGIGAETAAAIGAVAGPAIFGAGSGALLAGVTGGNPLTGALTGALSGGLIGGLGGATGALTSAVGSETAADALLGAGAGAVGSAATGGNPLTGALTGAAGGVATSALSSLSGAGTGAVDPAFVNADGSLAVPPVPPMLDASGNPVLDVSGNPVYSTPADATAAAQTNALTQPGATGYSASLNPQSALSSANGAATSSGTSSGGGLLGSAKGLLSNPALALGALSAASTFLNKPQQGGYAIPTAQSAVSGNFNQPLSPPGTFPGATYTNPNVPNYYTYGSIPGGANYFKNNSLAAYGFARGGELSANDNSDSTWIGPGQEFSTAGGVRHVRGPGTGTSDLVPAMLSDGEYVLTKREVTDIAGKSNEAGARKLDRLRKTGALSCVLRKVSA